MTSTGRTFGKNALLSKLEVLFRRLKIHAVGLTMRQITNSFYDSIQGKSATAYYVLDPHFDTDADAPVKPHVEPSLAQRVSTIRPWHLAVYAIWFAANVGLFVGEAVKYSKKNLGNGFIIAKASASLIWLNLPLTLVPLVFRPMPFKIHYAAGLVVLAAGIAHTVGHMIFGKSTYKEATAITGWILDLIAVITIPLAFLRDYYYNTFYYSHMVLLFVYIPLAMIHAPVGPVYFHAGARLWIIMLVPLALYAWFRMPKFLFPKKTWVLSANLEEDVLVLAIDKKFTHTIGQYININIPELAYTEYHAFSLSNDPNSNVATMHIKNRGDWTNKLIERREQLTYVNFEGPFETATSNFIKYRTAIVVAVGIGITPFISILNYCPPHTRVHMIFTTRQQHLLTLVRPAGTVVPHVYFTRFRKSNNFEIFKMVHEAVFEATGVDCLSGMRTRTQFERPDWSILQEIRAQEMGPNTDAPDATDANARPEAQKIGVFFCGPYAIEKHVRRHCGGMDFYTETF